MFLLILVLLLSQFIGVSQATVPYTNSRVNLDNSGNQANHYTGITGGSTSISKDGRYVSFSSKASNLVASDTNSKLDIFVRDRTNNQTTRVSVSSAGVESNRDSTISKISYDGRYVVFVSPALNLVTGTIYGYNNVYLHDRQLGTTELISVPSSGSTGNSNSGKTGIDVSRDGRYVVYSSEATNLVSGDTNGAEDVFVRDRKLGTTTRISVDSSGTQGNGQSTQASMSCDGAIVAFHSGSNNLVSGDTNSRVDTFIVNRVGGHEVTNITIGGDLSSASSVAPVVSCDGGTVAYISSATNLVAGDTNSYMDAFAYNISTAATELVSQSTGGTIGKAENDPIGISGDGRYISFMSYGTALVSGDTNAKGDIFLRDRISGVTERVSMRDATTQTNQHSGQASISPDGTLIAFVSGDDALVSGDTNYYEDVFVAETGGIACSL